MKSTILLIILLTWVTNHICQIENINYNNRLNRGYSFDTDYAKNALFAELGGNGFLFSVNYERLIHKNIGIRIGYGGRVYPVMINFYGNGNNKIEAGFGISYIAEEIQFFDNQKTMLIATTLGLRHQKSAGGTVVRLSFTPFYNPTTGKVLLFGGISLGWSF